MIYRHFTGVAVLRHLRNVNILRVDFANSDWPERVGALSGFLYRPVFMQAHRCESETQGLDP
jgi:hypothetical protein